MNRRSFIGGFLAVGGSILVGKEGIVQEEPDNLEMAIKISDNGDFIFPGFFTIFVDGKESFRMVVGDSITVERDCHIIGYNGFENRPSIDYHLYEGYSITIS